MDRHPPQYGPLDRASVPADQKVGGVAVAAPHPLIQIGVGQPGGGGHNHDDNDISSTIIGDERIGRGGDQTAARPAHMRAAVMGMASARALPGSPRPGRLTPPPEGPPVPADHPTPRPPGEARFDPALNAWVLSRYADVAAALQDPRLSATGADIPSTSADAAVRGTTAGLLAPDRPAGWWRATETSARELAGGLPVWEPVDLAGAFARPWAAALAARATAAPADPGGRLGRLAAEVFRAAADATGGGFPPPAQAAAAELSRSFPGPGAGAAVQAYVALSQTLPCVLLAAWLELARRPGAAARLRADPGLLPGAVDELLRLAGPARAVFRHAVAAAAVGGARLAPGDRVVLLLAAANRDPARFPAPDRLDPCRPARHLGFGGGPHACPAAPLVRRAVAVATAALLGATAGVELAGEVEWTGGFAIRGPATLPVVVRRGPPAGPMPSA